MKYIFVDFEMNGISREYPDIKKECSSEIVEIGAVMLDENFEEAASYKQYVKPQYNSQIEKGCAKVTSITMEMLEEQPFFEEALTDFIEWCAENAGSENYEILSWSECDYMQLTSEMKIKNYPVNSELEWMLDNWTDYQEEYTDTIGYWKKLSLEHAIGSVGQKFAGKQHDALWDARNTARIFSIVQDDEQFEKILTPLIEALQPAEVSTFKLGSALSKALESKKIV